MLLQEWAPFGAQNFAGCAPMSKVGTVSAPLEPVDRHS
jgi:hypothetical protein